MPDGGYALSGLQNRSDTVGRISASAIRQSISDIDFAFICGLTAAVLTPAEIGEPKRE